MYNSIAKEISQAEAMSKSKKIKPIALAPSSPLILSGPINFLLHFHIPMVGATKPDWTSQAFRRLFHTIITKTRPTQP